MQEEELSMSIDEIKKFIEKRDADCLENMLASKSLEIDEKIKQLKQIKNVLDHKKSMLETARVQDLNEIQVVQCKDEYLFLTRAGDEEIIDFLIQIMEQ